MAHDTAKPTHQQHGDDARLLRERDARLGEATVTGERWWPHETWKYADLQDEGQHLTSYERWLADRERERRRRRETMASIVKRESIKWEKTRAPGVFVAYMVAPHMETEAPSHIVELIHLRPGAATIPARENESVYHVLRGSGHSLIYGERHDWEPHASIHVQEGAWYQHVNSGSDPVVMIAGRVTPLMEQVYTMNIVYKGDSFSDLPDDFKPEHPFTKERVDVPEHVGGIKWMSQMQKSHHDDKGGKEKESRDARKVLHASEAVIQRSHHKGDWKVGLIDPYLGFTNRILGMYVHQMPPDCHTETHKHGWATIYVMTGQGYSLVDEKREDWQMGDIINVPAGAWHQHFNTDPAVVSQHLLISPDPFRQKMHLTQGAVEESYQNVPELSDAGYQPTGEWWR